jgi:hypothetical protein
VSSPSGSQVAANSTAPLCFGAADVEVGGNALGFAEHRTQVVAQTVFVVPFELFAAGFVEQAHGESGAEHGLRAQHVLEARQRDFRRIEILRIGPEAHRRAGLLLRHGAGHAEVARAIAVLEVHAMDLAVAADRHFHALRQRVDHRHADAVQAAGKLVIAIRKLAARVQAREDEFDAGNAFFRMDVDRHAAAVVADFNRTVRVQGDVDRLRVAGERFVDRVVDDFLREVVRPRGVGVHARTAFDRVEAGQDFDVGGVVTGIHARQIQNGSSESRRMAAAVVSIKPCGSRRVALRPDRRTTCPDS